MRGLLWRILGVDKLPDQSRKKLGVVALLYFIQGAPAAILWELLPVYFRINGVSLRAIGGAAAPGASLFVKSVLVAAGAPLR